MPQFDLDGELEALVRALDGKSVDYALCGGLALAVHGHPRATKDIDLLMPGAAVSAANAILRGLGFDVEAMPMTFASGIEMRRLSKVAADAVLSVDIVIVEPNLVGAWASKMKVSWRGSSLVVVSREGLIEMKRRAHRPQDLADLHVLGAEAADE